MTSRKISCPRCGKPSLFTPENPYRPFCSERCKTIDLGNWADGRYAIPINEGVPAESQDESDDERDEKMSRPLSGEDVDSSTESDFDDGDRHRH